MYSLDRRPRHQAIDPDIEHWTVRTGDRENMERERERDGEGGDGGVGEGCRGRGMERERDEEGDGWRGMERERDGEGEDGEGEACPPFILHPTLATSTSKLKIGF
jgi:hypothetical protein